jgi:hypothetical protein
LSRVLAVAWGTVAMVAGSPVVALDPPPPIPPEVVISADRAADAVLESQVIEVLRDDPYVFAEHVSVTVADGVVTVTGTVPSVQDMRRVLRLARRLAGKRRIVNRLELDLEDDVGTG